MENTGSMLADKVVLTTGISAWLKAGYDGRAWQGVLTDEVVLMSEMRPNSGQLVGQTVDGYVILNEIGSGAASVVYQAMEPLENNKLVALKVLDRAEQHLAGGVRAENPFERELRVAERFQDPGILRIFRVGELHDGRFYMAMEFVEGMTLAEELRHRERVPWREACEIVEALSWSLAPLHEVGIVHRDVTPQNVMLRLGKDKRLHTKLIDFGAVKLPGEWDEDLQGAVGTPQYMAPEQADGRGASVSSDVYAMGALFYELLTGHSALRLPSPSAEACEAYLREQRPVPTSPLVELAPETPAPLIDLVTRTLAYDPGRRPKDAFAFAHELGDAFDASSEEVQGGAFGWVKRLLGSGSD